MALYKVASGDFPLASDIDQIVDIFSGTHDIGAITLAPAIAVPAAPTAAVISGTGLGVGSYIYVMTYKTGYKKTNGTMVYSGETPASASVTISTTSGNQQIRLSALPASWPASAVGLAIYRTAVGGAAGTQKLVTVLTSIATTYTDTTADAALGAAVPTVNTTGTTLTSSGNVSIANGFGITTPGGASIVTGSGGGTFSVKSGNASANSLVVNHFDGTPLLTVGPNGAKSVTTVKNTLDDGNGAATFAGSVTFAAGVGPHWETYGTNAITSGNADAASYTAYNIKFHGHNGMAMETYDGTVNGYYDFRGGKWDVKDGYYVNGTKMPQMRVNGGTIEWNNAGTWQGVGGVKGVQRGTSTVSPTPGFLDVTITAVVMAKASVNLLSQVTFSADSADVHLELLNSTTIRATYSSTNAGSKTIRWEVVESY